MRGSNSPADDVSRTINRHSQGKFYSSHPPPPDVKPTRSTLPLHCFDQAALTPMIFDQSLQLARLESSGKTTDFYFAPGGAFKPGRAGWSPIAT